MPLHTIHRPQKLDDIIGNESVVESLRSVLGREKDKPHSFLFTGNSGCGKTTMGKILKNELNCSDSDYYFFNASNTRGIETVRDIQEMCSFAPMNGDVKLFALEECHQITGAAQEALLTILEEPPAHVYFVLCTTEPEKLKPTVRRRCHSYEMKPLNPIQLNKLISRTLLKEGVKEFPDDVIHKIISVCDGSPGKALNLLDTVIDVADDEHAFKVIEEASISESNIAEIARMLLSGNGLWSSIARMIEGLTGEPESLRRAFLSYFGKVLLNPQSNFDKVAAIMMNFMEPVFNTGKPGIALAIYFSFKESKLE